MSLHTITAQVPVKFGFSGFDGHEIAYPTLEITYEYRKGSPEVGPTFSHGGLPADPPEIELKSVRLIDGDGLDPGMSPPGEKYIITEWADDFLNSDDGYFLACNEAEAATYDDYLEEDFSYDID